MKQTRSARAARRSPKKHPARESHLKMRAHPTRKKAEAAVAAATRAIKGFSPVLVPRIGAYWKGEGGYFAGIGRNADDGGDHILIVHYTGKDKRDHAGALAYPGTVQVDGKKDWESPTLRDGALAYASLKERFGDNWCWLREQDPGDRDWARFQSFRNGNQDFSDKGIQGLVFAVRRIPIR